MAQSKQTNSQNKFLSPPVVVVGILVVGVIGLYALTQSSDNGANGVPSPEAGSNVSIVDGKQIIEIRAKGGYQPLVSTAKAGIPTVLKVDTSGTFDCSSALRIPSMNISEMLPATGSTEIALGELAAGTLDGTCGMGMYPFQIEVQS